MVDFQQLCQRLPGRVPVDFHKTHPLPTSDLCWILMPAMSSLMMLLSFGWICWKCGKPYDWNTTQSYHSKMRSLNYNLYRCELTTSVHSKKSLPNHSNHRDHKIINNHQLITILTSLDESCCVTPHQTAFRESGSPWVSSSSSSKGSWGWREISGYLLHSHGIDGP